MCTNSTGDSSVINLAGLLSRRITLVTLIIYFSALISYGASQTCSLNCVTVGCNQTGPGKCDRCDQGYGLTATGSCAPCSSNCAVGCSRTGAGKCDKCDPGYGPASSDGSCGPCDPFCNSTVGCNVSGTCLQCNRGFGLTINSTCGQCHKNCNNTVGCNTSGTCLVCNTGYGLTNTSTCDPCDPNCNLTIGCNTSGTCLLCNRGFGLTSTKTCSPCSFNCAAGCSKNGAGKCDQCDFGFGLTPTNSCAPCSSNCAAGCNLTGAGKCDKCDAGYGPASDGSCAPCSASCSAGCNRTGAGKCDKCDLGYGLTSTNTCAPCASNCVAGCNATGAGKCDKCDGGYGLASNGSCGLCASNCTVGCTLTGAGKCDKCNSGYGLSSNGSCEPCASNCFFGCFQTGAGKCDKCNQGYGLTSSGSCAPCSSYCTVGCNQTGAGKCDLCDTGYGIAFNGSCAPCSLNCAIGCNQAGAGKCDKCDFGFGLTSTSSCAPCSSNCAAGCNLLGAGRCDKCDAGYGTTVDRSCAPCSANCNITVGCGISGTCTLCNAGYEANSSRICVVITTTTTATTTTIAKSTSTAATTTTTSTTTPNTPSPPPLPPRTITATTIRGSTATANRANTIQPTYGPMAGGTVITIVTTWTSPNILISAVYIGSNLKAGNLSQSTSTTSIDSSYQITALVRSPRITDESLVDKPLPIILEIYPDFVNVNTEMYFTYKRNATIYDINPKVIPLSGGIHLTVTGSNLASASNPVIRAVVTVWRNNILSSRNESSAPCYQPNENGTQMTCLSPPIYIPQDFLLYLFGQTDPYSDVYRRRKREDIFSIDWLKEHETPLTLRSRLKRASNTQAVPSIQTDHKYELPGDASTNSTMEVSLNAGFDGLQVPLSTAFNVFIPPNISCADNIYFDSGTITITGNGMSACCGKTDYSVRIGNGFCNVTDLTDNELKCEPPKDKPQQTVNDTRYCGVNFAVFIDVGNKTYRCSCLTYADSSKTTLTIVIAAAVGGSVLLIGIVTVMILILIKGFRTSAERPPTQEASIRNQMVEKKSGMMVRDSRQPNDIRILNHYEIGGAVLPPEGYFNRAPRPGYTAMATNQSYGYGYRYHNPSYSGYAGTFEGNVYYQPQHQMYLPYTRNF